MIRRSAAAEGTKVTFVLPVDAVAGRCSVVGNFNGWRPGTHELRRRGNGTRSVAITVSPGTRIVFRYLAQDGHWFNDPDISELLGDDTVIVA